MLLIILHLFPRVWFPGGTGRLRLLCACGFHTSHFLSVRLSLPLLVSLCLLTHIPKLQKRRLEGPVDTLGSALSSSFLYPQFLTSGRKEASYKVGYRNETSPTILPSPEENRWRSGGSLSAILLTGHFSRLRTS